MSSSPSTTTSSDWAVEFAYIRGAHVSKAVIFQLSAVRMLDLTKRFTYSLYALSDIIRVVKSRKIIYNTHGRNAYTIFDRKT
jgi:hypothetical protein